MQYRATGRTLSLASARTSDRESIKQWMESLYLSNPWSLHYWTSLRSSQKNSVVQRLNRERGNGFWDCVPTPINCGLKETQLNVRLLRLLTCPSCHSRLQLSGEISNSMPLITSVIQEVLVGSTVASKPKALVCLKSWVQYGVAFEYVQGSHSGMTI